MNIALAAFGSVAVMFAIKGVIALLPDSAIYAAFQFVPELVAREYYGELPFKVARSCAATDFFSMVAAIPLVGRKWRLAPFAWVIAVSVNTLRIIALVPVERVFPKATAPWIHQGVGSLFFLPVLIAIWYYTFERKARNQ